MTWLVWRQYRTHALCTGALTAVLALLLIITGLHMGSIYHAALPTCTRDNTCGHLFQGSGYSALSTIVVATVTVPALLGLFWGAPLVAAEFEHGTHQFIWTQSVARSRWLIAKISWILLAAAVWGTIVAGTVTWWSHTRNSINHDRFYSAAQFDIQGMVPIAYSIFAVALGIAAGTIFKRIVPALGATLAVFGPLLLILQTFARPHYIPAVTKALPLTGPPVPTSSWLLSGEIVNPSGAAVGHIGNGTGNWNIQGSPPANCVHLMNAPQSVLRCLSADGYHAVLTYQPASRYWAFQGIESGIFVILAAILAAVTIRLILRRDA